MYFARRSGTHVMTGGGGGERLFNPDDQHDACGIALVADVRARSRHDVLARALEALRRMTHRGPSEPHGAADGAGVLTAIPWDLLSADLPPVFASDQGTRAAGVCLFPAAEADTAQAAAEAAFRRLGWSDVHWRPVPTDPAALSRHDRTLAPRIVQVFARHDCANRSTYTARAAIDGAWRRAGLLRSAIVSLSRETIVYKALVAPAGLPRFFPDLLDPLFVTPFAIVHQRFSTNTLPRWDLAQPFGTIAHNGEINTIGGNRLWLRARMAAPDALPVLAENIAPLVHMDGSDSQTLDDTIELLREAGHSTPEALARLLPAAWENDEQMSAAVRAFYQYGACFSEPWEGPAAIVFADGRYAGALVDRNGFRPIRTLETADGLVCAASEAGVFDVPAAQVISRDRLGPGEMLVVDLEAHTVTKGVALQEQFAQRTEYVSGVVQFVRAPAAAAATEQRMTPAAARRAQHLFGWTREDVELIVKTMACEGHESVGSMGDDAPLAVLAKSGRPLAHFFRQRFAQVTNPPLDPIRESHVMSLRTMLGRRGTWRSGGSDPALLELGSPVLSADDLAAIGAQEHVRVSVLPIIFPADAGARGLHHALLRLQTDACAAVDAGASVLVLSDRVGTGESAPVPALLATAAIDQALRDCGLRLRASLVVETAEVRDSHQVATLCGFGASAVFPYLLYETAAGFDEGAGAAASRCRAALEEGLLKILSKMGVCTLEAYAGARLFEAIGLDRSVVDAFFAGVPSRLGGLTLDDLASQAIARWATADAAAAAPLPHTGFHTFRRDGEHHAFNPVIVRRLHDAAAGDATGYRALADLVAARPASAVRDLLEFAPGTPIAIESVEPVESICRRFFTSAMSLGALGPEAHRVLAIAMNRIGGRSNCGEGGEEPDRYGAIANSATKQVASARFGVTPAYLISATELQIKMAQGSKPGEGGQLPGAKVNVLIARLRHAQPGTALISPPPHHDIYSIEDLAQLIYDLRAFNPRARINVKLVAQAGIGIVAAGVVKAGADAIQISGHDGGTGASPRGSIKHSGSPWELGLAEAHQALVACGLRDRVVLQTDGGLQAGRDLAIAAAFGAEEFGFGTAALVAIGCVMARQCHQNTCPVGIATQRADLRQRFEGTPEMATRYLELVAQDFREILARLGVRSVAELVGRTDLLRAREGVAAPGTFGVSALLTEAPSPACRTRQRSQSRSTNLNMVLSRSVRGRLGHKPIAVVAAVRNTDRAVGAPLAGELAAEYGDAGTTGAPFELRLTGSAGQSLWAFALPGMHVRLQGEANDGVGKGMHGGEIVIRPPVGTREASPVLVGNAALYGATGGRLFVAGRAGERFAVRNSGAWAVVEGLGDHGCEYMTEGAVLVLGRIGRNFAAGMTGGVAYVFDVSGDAEGRTNTDTVLLEPGLGHDEQWIRAWLVEHRERTGSAIAADLLRRWPALRDRFVTVRPKSAVAASATAEAPVRVGVRP